MVMVSTRLVNRGLRFRSRGAVLGSVVQNGTLLQTRRVGEAVGNHYTHNNSHISNLPSSRKAIKITSDLSVTLYHIRLDMKNYEPEHGNTCRITEYRKAIRFCFDDIDRNDGFAHTTEDKEYNCCFKELKGTGYNLPIFFLDFFV